MRLERRLSSHAPTLGLTSESKIELLDTFEQISSPLFQQMAPPVTYRNHFTHHGFTPESCNRIERLPNLAMSGHGWLRKHSRHRSVARLRRSRQSATTRRSNSASTSATRIFIEMPAFGCFDK